jgi:phage terminase large subunit
MVAPLKTGLTAAEILATPAGFARGILGLPLYDSQAAILTELERQGTKISAVCCNEAGKTSHIAAPAILWCMQLFPGSTVVVTSGSWRQVRDQLFPGLARFAPRFAGWTFTDTRISSPKGSRCVGFSTDDAGLFEGFHVGPGGHRETPLMIIVDEAKSVHEGIFQAIDRCRPTWLLLLSSPGAATGRFYESHTKHRSHYRAHKITAADCPHIAQSVLDDIIARYGADHPFVRSSFHAEFSEGLDTGQVITLTKVQACLQNPPARKLGERNAWVDFAAGGDENVIALREGNQVRLIRCWREANTMVACGEFIAEFRKLGLRAEEITGDEGGLGKVMLDRLAELGWQLNRANSNDKSTDSAYYNRAAQIWAEGASQIDRRQVIIPDDAVALEQLTGRLWKRFSDGRLQLESKEEMRKRGLSSPDRAECILGAMQGFTSYLPRNYNAQTPLDILEEFQATREGTLYAGFNAGG